jgi:L-asparaginase
VAVIVVHGGAGARGDEASFQDRMEAARAIADASWSLLRAGASAREAVVDAVRRLEADPRFNAGVGSKLQADGAARLSASLMDAGTGRFGGVVNVEGVLSPVVIANHLLEADDRVLAGAGAAAAAAEAGAARGDPTTPRAWSEWNAKRQGMTGTVGAVALDHAGRIAAATSTGGRGFERPGRVSDSCTVAGTYASAVGGASCTGVGEEIVEAALACRVVLALELGLGLDDAMARARAALGARGGRAGVIAVDAAGRVGAFTTTEAMVWAVAGAPLAVTHDVPT